MKFSISAKDLKRALNTCSEVAPAKSNIIEEKTGVLLRAAGESVIFMSNDETLFVKVEVPAVVEEAGDALVKGNSVADSVSATFEDVGYDGQPNVIKLETTSKSTLKISGSNKIREGKSHSHVRNFPLLNLGFFIETPSFDESKASLFPAFQFMDGLNRVSYAASKDPSKLHLNCIALTLEENEVRFAATDGIQIAEFNKAAEVPGLRGFFILGLKFASIASKLVNPGKFDNVEVYVDGDNFHLRSGGTSLVGMLINTSFPKYASYMKTKKLNKAVFARDDLLSILLSMQPTVDAKSHRLVIDAKKSGTADLSTSSITGEAESSNLEVITPEDFVLHFDSVRLQNALNQIKGDEFEFYFSDSAKGVLLKSTKDEDFKAYVCTLKKVD